MHIGCLGKLLSTWRTTFSLSLIADDVGCDLPVTEPESFHRPTTFSPTDVSLLLDPEYGMLYLQNSHTTSALDVLGANWSRICLSRALNHSALWHIVFWRFRNVLTYLLTCLLTYIVVGQHVALLTFYWVLMCHVLLYFVNITQIKSMLYVVSLSSCSSLCLFCRLSWIHCWNLTYVPISLYYPSPVSRICVILVV